MSDFNIYAQLRLFLSLFFLTLQFITLPHFIFRQEYRSATSFRIMFAIGLCECYQKIVMGICPFLKYLHFYSPFVENTLNTNLSSIFPIYANFGKPFRHSQEFLQMLAFFTTMNKNDWNKITGALLESTLDTLFLLNLLLAINRLIVMVKMNVLHQFGEGESKREKIMYMTLYIISAFAFIFLTVLFMSPYCGLSLNEEYIIWDYNWNLSWSASVNEIERYGYIGLPTICFLIYCTIVVLMKANASKLLSNNESIAMQKAREFRIFLQSLIQFLIFIIPIVYSNLHFRIGNTALEKYGVSSVGTIIYTGINPILYLLLLPKLRAQVISSLTFGIKFKYGKSKKQSATMGNTVNVQPAARRSIAAAAAGGGTGTIRK